MPISKIKTVSIADDAITGAKLENNPTIAGNLTVTGTSTANGAFTSKGIDDNADAIAITITDAEKVGIGTATPHTTMEIVTTDAGSVSESLQIRNNSVSSGTGSKIRMINSTDATSDTNSVSITSNRTGDDNFMTVEVENTEQMRITHTGDTTLTNGSLIIGTSGKGIDFSSTSDATGKDNELLDDYEEGSWTPTADNLTGTQPTYAGAEYTRIGRQVSFSFKVTMPTTDDGDSFVISGLPFTSVGDYAATCQINYSMNTLLHFALSGNETKIHGYYNGTNLTYTTVSTKIIIITGTYFTN